MAGLSDEDLRAEVAALRRRQDEMRHVCQLKEHRIHLLQGHLDEIAYRRKLARNDLPQADSISKLEGDIKDMEARLEESEETRLTYLQMIDRLKRESAFFNRDLAKVTSAANAKELDEIELQLMLKDAIYVKYEANKRCSEFEQQAQSQQKQRRRELALREKHLEKRRTQFAEHEGRMAVRRAEFLAQQQEARATIDRPVKNLTTVGEELQLIKEYEEEFKHIQHVAGASEVSDVIDKFLHQENIYNMLNLMKNDLNKRISATREAKAEAQAAVERFRYEGVDESANQDTAALPPNRFVTLGGEDAPPPPIWSVQHEARLRRATRMLVDVRAGLQHMIDLFTSVPLEVEVFDGSMEGEEKLLEALEYCVRNIKRLLQSTSSDPVVPALAMSGGKGSRSLGTASRAAIQAEVSAAAAADEGILMLNRKSDNLRIKDEDEEEDEDDDDDDDDPDLPKDAVMSSGQVKEQAGRIILKNTKPKRRRGRSSPQSPQQSKGSGAQDGAFGSVP